MLRNREIGQPYIPSSVILFNFLLPEPLDEPLSQQPAGLSTDVPVPQLPVSADSAVPAVHALVVTHGEH